MSNYNLLPEEKIGTVLVDAGLIWVGDPCYVLPEDASHAIGRDWQAFCKDLAERDEKGANDVYTFEGTGIAVGSGYGDGEYNVYVRRDRYEGRVMELRISFEEDPYEEEEEEDDGETEEPDYLWEPSEREDD